VSNRFDAVHRAEPVEVRWLFRIYNGLVVLAVPVILLFIALRWRRRFFSKGFDRWSQRWGHLPEEQLIRIRAKGPWWWVHAVSLGEVKAIETFLRKAPTHARAQILLSVVTPEAIAYAVENKVAQEIIAAPIDLPWVVRRVFKEVRPQIFISVESEFWPNLLREAKRSGARVALINGRLSEHSFKSYSHVRWIMQALWGCFDLWAVRQEQDAVRFRSLGVPTEKIQVTGNLKYDSPIGSGSQESAQSPKRSVPVVVLGSTREGEESQLLPVLQKLRAQWPELKVIWAPRHLDRISEIETLLTAQGLSCRRKSLPGAADQNGHPPANILWDTMGDLLEAYRQADVAVVGGSFVPKGGQNPIEPAALRLPVVFGPSMDNFHGIADALVESGGARQVSLTELSECLNDLLKNPELRRTMGDKARRAVENEQGATQRTLTLLEKLVRA